MSLVPSHDCFFLKETAGNTCLPIDSHRFNRLFQFADGISQNNLVAFSVQLLKYRLPIFNRHATHLLARYDRLSHPFARATVRYL